jgi:hypothetical protein
VNGKGEGRFKGNLSEPDPKLIIHLTPVVDDEMYSVGKTIFLS